MAGEHPQPEMQLADELFLAELSPSSAFSEAAPNSLDQAPWRRSICLENSEEEAAAFPSTFLEGDTSPFRFVEEAESGNDIARMNSSEMASPPVLSFHGPEEPPGNSQFGHLLSQTPTLTQAQAQAQAPHPLEPQTDAHTQVTSGNRPSCETEQASAPAPVRATRFPARFGITDDILEEAERGGTAAEPPLADPSVPASFPKDMQSEAGSAGREPVHENPLREVLDEAQLASDAGPCTPGDASAVAVASGSRDGVEELQWDAGMGYESSEPSTNCQGVGIQPGASDFSGAQRPAEGAAQLPEPREGGPEQGRGAHVAEQGGDGSAAQAGEARAGSLGSRTVPLDNQILHLDTSLGAVRQPPGNASEDRTSLAPRLASLLREIKRRPGGASAGPPGRPSLPSQLRGLHSASVSGSGSAQLDHAWVPRQDRASSRSSAESASTDVAGAFAMMGLQDFSSANAFLVTQYSVTSLKRRVRQSASAPAAHRGQRGGRGGRGGKQAAKGEPGAEDAKEMDLALPPGVFRDESSAEATLRRLLSAAPDTKQRPLVPKSGHAPVRRRVLLPRQPLHSLSQDHFRHPFVVSAPLGSRWPVALYSPHPRPPPRLDPGQNGSVADGVVSRMARSNLLALADAYMANHTAAIQPLTEILRSVASPHGNSTERVVHYTLAALEARFRGKPLGPLFASMSLSPQADVEASQYETGWKVFEEIANTYTLVDALRGPSRVHILLINDMGGICWTTLFQGLADQAGGAPAVRVTVLKIFLLGAGDGGGEDGELGLGARVSEAAARAGVPLAYRIICAQPSELHPGMVTVDPEEAVAVVSCWALAIFPDARVLPSNPRNSMLKWIHSLSPRVFLLSEIDSDFNGGPFAARFREFLMKVGAGFEFMGNSMPLGSPSRKALEVSFVAQLVDVIAFEGLGRANRTERCEMWVDRLLSVGFSQRALPQKVWEALRDLSTINQSFHVSNQGGVARFHLCGVPNFFCSAWSC